MQKISESKKLAINSKNKIHLNVYSTLGYITLFLGSNEFLMGCMSRCKGQFVHIPPPPDDSDNIDISESNPKNVHIPPPRANPKNHSEYENKASCCEMC